MKKTVLAAFAVLLLCTLGSLAFGQQPITIFLAGDSTMAEKLPTRRPETGWAEQLQNFFDESKVRVENHAQNGRSTRSFIAENRWQAIVGKLKEGDYVFIQFGHNDSKENTDRYASPADYRKNLVRFITDAREKKAIPVLLTPIMRRRFDQEGRFQDTHGEYPGVVRVVAAEYTVVLIDMHRKSELLIRLYGAEESRRLFLQLKPIENPNYPVGIEDNTHFSPVGAKIMASLAIEGIREQKLGLQKYLKTVGQSE